LQKVSVYLQPFLRDAPPVGRKLPNSVK